jgi:hypothetical protein
MPNALDCGSQNRQGRALIEPDLKLQESNSLQRERCKMFRLGSRVELGWVNVAQVRRGSQSSPQ